MAEAKKCDRCGKLYEIYVGIPLVSGGNKYHAVKFANFGCSTAWLDLCPDCMKKLVIFMENK